MKPGDIFMVVSNPCGVSVGSRVNESIHLGSIGDPQTAALLLAFNGRRMVNPQSTKPTAQKATDNPDTTAKSDLASAQGAEVGAAQASAASKAKAADATTAQKKADAAAKAAGASAALKASAAKADAAAKSTAAALDKATKTLQAAQAKVAAAAAQKPAAGDAGTTSTDAIRPAATPSTVQITINAAAGAPTPAASESAPAKGAGAGDPANSAQPTASSSEPLLWVDDKGAMKDGIRPLNRLEIAAFPEISLATITKAQAAVSAPLGGLFNFSGAAAYQRQVQVDVSALGVETSGVPAPMMLVSAVRFIKSPQGQDLASPYVLSKIQQAAEDRMIAEGEQMAKCAAPVRRKFVLLFANRVYYARTLKFNYGVGSALGLSGGLTTPLTTTATTQTTAGGQATSTTATNSNAGAIPALSLPSAPAAPGATFGYEVGSNASLVMNQTFDRPLAIGISPDVMISQDELGRLLAASFHRELLTSSVAPQVVAAPALVPAPARPAAAAHAPRPMPSSASRGGRRSDEPKLMPVVLVLGEDQPSQSHPYDEPEQGSPDLPQRIEIQNGAVAAGPAPAAVATCQMPTLEAWAACSDVCKKEDPETCKLFEPREPNLPITPGNTTTSVRPNAEMLNERRTSQTVEQTKSSTRSTSPQ